MGELTARLRRYSVDRLTDMVDADFAAAVEEAADRLEALEKPKVRKGFVPPTREEVRAYVRERGSDVDPDRFWEYFDVSDWVDGQGKPVRNWKQKLLTWEGRKPKKTEASGNIFLDMLHES